MLDSLSLTVVFASMVFCCTTLYFLTRLVVQIYKKERRFKGGGYKGFIKFLFSLVVIGAFYYCLYHIPDILLYKESWAVIERTGSKSIIISTLSIFTDVTVFFLYYILNEFFVKNDERPYFLVVVLSVMSGLGNSLIIFFINESLNREKSYETGIYMFYILGVLLSSFGALTVRKKLISLTTGIVYSMRIKLIDRILKMSLEKIEKVGSEKIYTVLNTDTEAVSYLANVLIGVVTASITLICYCIYLGFLNLYGLIASLVVFASASIVFLAVSRSAKKMWEKARDIQNTFYRFINDLLNGFKELYMHKNRREEFYMDMMKCCDSYRKNRVEGENRFTSAFVVGETAFQIATGAALFIFPMIFAELKGNVLRNYVFVFISMAGAVNTIVHGIPGIINVRISWKRITDIVGSISMVEVLPDVNANEIDTDNLFIKLDNVKYSYKNENGEKFSVGPINMEIGSREIVFITGGNGSGKSTLAKLITGLYRPDEGSIFLNGKNVASGELSSLFSTVFSDYYLFSKLYGINTDKRLREISEYLKTLRIDQKVDVKDGAFTTTELSTGQKKRLALLVSYLEDRPFYLFDEWAADQDPEFRSFFYNVLMPQLKAKGKCVIAITHDDRYFGLADKLVKMETGTIVESLCRI
ncbi:MAG: cyclic peptide export ABC transporter [Clostridia bacterium]|nr:cyclic peptide export ABC transporter [Clostridia bacterium]